MSVIRMVEMAKRSVLAFLQILRRIGGSLFIREVSDEGTTMQESLAMLRWEDEEENGE